VIATVIDDKNVEYEGVKYSLTGLANKLTGRKNTQGPMYFHYKGQPLHYLRAEYEDEQDFDDEASQPAVYDEE
jgi:hypothetical protein